MKSERGLLIIAGLLGILMLSGWLIAFRQNRTAHEKQVFQKPTIAVTIYPLYDIVRNVAGTDGAITLIMSPGLSPDLYTPTTADIKRIKGVTSIIRISSKVEPWTDILAKTVGISQIASMDKNWLNLEEAQIIAHNAADVLSKNDPTHQVDYQNRATSYGEQIQQMLVVGKKQCSNQVKLVSIPSENWKDLADELGLTASISAKPTSLDSIGGSIDRDTYLQLMKNNIDVLCPPATTSGERSR